MTSDQRDPSRRVAPGAAALLGIGATFGGCVAVGVFLGVLGDHELGTSPLLALLGLITGILLGVQGAYLVIRPYLSSEKSRTPRKG